MFPTNISSTQHPAAIQPGRGFFMSEIRSPERGKQLQSVKRGEQVTRAAVSPDEAALMVGLSRSRIYQLIGSGELRSIKVGRRRLVPMSAISELLGEAA